MEKSKIICIYSVLLVVVSLVLSFCAIERGAINNRAKVHELRDSLRVVECQRDSLKVLIDEADVKIESLSDSVSNIKERVVYIKSVIYEKVDSIKSLSIDDSIEFFSAEISKEDCSR